MGQAGLTTYEEAGRNASHGIMDFSTKEASDKYTLALYEFLKNMESEAAKGRAVHGIFEYPSGLIEKVKA